MYLSDWKTFSFQTAKQKNKTRKKHFTFVLSRYSWQDSLLSIPEGDLSYLFFAVVLPLDFLQTFHIRRYFVLVLHLSSCSSVQVCLLLFSLTWPVIRQKVWRMFLSLQEGSWERFRSEEEDRRTEMDRECFSIAKKQGKGILEEGIMKIWSDLSTWVVLKSFSRRVSQMKSSRSRENNGSRERDRERETAQTKRTWKQTMEKYPEAKKKWTQRTWWSTEEGDLNEPSIFVLSFCTYFKLHFHSHFYERKREREISLQQWVQVPLDLFLFPFPRK